MTTRFACLLVVLGAVRASGEDVEERLDLPLKLLHRSQASAPRAEGVGGERLRPERAMRLLERLRPGRRELRQRAALPPGSEAIPLSLLVKYTGDAGGLEAVGFRQQARVGSIYTGRLQPDRLTALANVPGVQFVQLSQELRAAHHPMLALPAAWASSGWASPPSADLAGTGVVVAFVDTGVDIFHHDFRKPDGTTRVKFLLDLSDPGDLDFDGDLDGAGPFGGTLYSEADINAALQSVGIVAQKDTTGHGSHGLSVAAGDDPVFPGIAPAADVIVVKATREDGTLGFTAADVVNALAFVDEKAGELGRPYVVNLSLGTIVASHDGRSLEEQAVDALVGPGVPGKVAVVAAGNSSDNRSTRYRHVRDTSHVGVQRAHALTIPAYAPNPDQGDDRIVVVFWYEGPDQQRLSVTTPGGTEVNASFGEFVDVETTEGNVFVANLGGANPENGDIEAIVILDDWAGTPPAPGVWTLGVMGQDIGESGEYDGWLADESLVGSERPYFSSNADNFYLVGKPGASFNAITVGSFALHDGASRYRTSWTDVNGLARVDTTALLGDISDFSSPGATRDGRVKPELTAPGERVLGAVSADAYPGLAPASIYRFHPFPEVDALIVDATPARAFGLLQGTSFSAPVVAGLAARILSTDPTLDAIQVRNILINTATTDSSTGAVPNDTWGYGKADLAVGAAPLPDPLRVLVDVLPEAVVDEPYDAVLTASGGTLPYSWTVSSGALPSGLDLGGTGLIDGTPDTPGTASFTVQVTDASLPPRVATRDLQIQVVEVSDLEILTRVLPPATLDKPYEASFQASGGTPGYSWSLVGGTLPSGLSLDPFGSVQGTPDTLGSSPFAVRVEDSIGTAALRSVRLRVRQPGSDHWSPLGIIATDVTYLAVDPNDTDHVLAATENAFDDSQDVVYESFDGGEAWEPISLNNGFFDAQAEWLAVSPRDSAPWAVRGSSLFGQREIVRYDAGTGFWDDTDACGASAPGAEGIHFDPAGNAYVFGDACGANGELRRSDDDGATWTSVGILCGGTLEQLGPPGPSLAIAPSNPTYMYATRHDPDLSVVCTSDDGGATWTQVDASATTTYMDVQVSSRDHLDAVRVAEPTTLGGWFLQRTTDGGSTWTQTALAGSGLACCLRRAPSDPAVLLFGTHTSLRYSSDHGAIWQTLPVADLPSIDVTSLSFDPTNADRFFVGSAQGLFYTEDAGQTWTLRNSGLETRGLTDLGISPTRPDDLVLGTSAGNLFLSRSGGDGWTETQLGVVNNTTAIRPAISAADADLFLVISSSGLRRSDNRGIDWVGISPPVIFGTSVRAFGADPYDADNMLVGITGGEIYRSTDRGANWSLIIDVTQVTDIAHAMDVPDRVYASSFSNVLRSDDGGASFSAIFGSSSIDLVEPAPSNSSYVYTSTGGTTSFFDPSVGSWQAATTDPPETVLSIAVKWDDPLTAWAGVQHPATPGGQGGVYKTTDGGRNWSRLSGVLDGFSVVSIVSHPTETDTLFAATTKGGVFRSDDAGASWTVLDRFGSISEVVNVTLQHPSGALLFAGTDGYGVQVSSNGGRTFSSRVTGLTNFNVNALAFESGSASVMYAGTDAGIFKSTDTGNTWAATAQASGEITDLVTDSDGTGRRIWGTVVGEGVAFSDDDGASFTVYNEGLVSLLLTSLELENTGSGRRIWGTTHGGDGVVFSDDDGQSWQSAAGNGLTDRNLNDLELESGTGRRIWGTTDSGVFFSEDDGLSWTELSLGLPSGIPVSSASIDPLTGEVLVSVFSELEGGVYRGGNVNGVWSAFSDGLDELKVQRLTNDGGRVVNPTTSATRFYAATAGDGSYASEIVTIDASAPSITTSSLASGLFHEEYSTTLAATGGTPPFQWSIAEGFLPAGLVLDPVAGVISGTPGQAGTFTFSVQVADAMSRWDTRQLSITVIDGPGLADLGITKGDGLLSAVPGQTTVTYTIVASNLGPSDVSDTLVTDSFPPSLSCTWTCVGAGGGSCTPGPVAGNLDDDVDLPVGATATYTVSCSIDPAATGTLSNTASIWPPEVVVDVVPGNNTATDADTALTPQADLGITKDDGQRFVVAGSKVPIRYQITVTNAGPSAVTGAAVTDTFPVALACTWRCTASGGATCKAGPVSGHIADDVDLPVGGMATYMADCRVSEGFNGLLSNTAIVTAPAGVTDPDPENDSATDTNRVLGRLLRSR